MTPCKTTAPRWKSHFHYHLGLILSENMKNTFMWRIFIRTWFYQRENIERGQSHKKSRCPWDGVYIAPVWQSCGKPSTMFPHGGLVECLFIQNTSSFFFLKSHLFICFHRNFSFSQFSGYLKPKSAKFYHIDIEQSFL